MKNVVGNGVVNMNEKLKLKPFPFCGGKAKFRTILNYSSHSNVGFDFVIECVKCKTSYSKTYTIRFELGNNGEIKPILDGREIALQAWNRRTENAEV